MTRVSVFGLGYVGAVTCACLTKDGFDVIGVDVNPDKVSMVNRGVSPVVESGVGELTTEGVRSGRLRATERADEAVVNSDVSIVSVGTPSEANGSLSLAAVTRVCEDIGKAVALKDDRHLVVVRSTVLPGTTGGIVVPTIERSAGKSVGQDFGVCFNPEFLREGSSIVDYYSPPYTLIGSWAEADGLHVADLYRNVDAPVHQVDVKTAEMVKYVSNAFHALKIAFANEVGSLAHPLDLDSHIVMDLLCQDTKLNISPKYLKPGFAFGGSCLPKDVRALLYRAKTADVELPLVQAVLESNRLVIERTIRLVLGLKQKRVAILGLSFKAGTDDLRESPLVQLAEALLGKGLDLKVFDDNVSLARLVGANKKYIEEEIPHLSSLLSEELEAVVEHGEVVLVGSNATALNDVPKLLRRGQIVVDLVRLPGLDTVPGVDYHGIAW